VARVALDGAHVLSKHEVLDDRLVALQVHLVVYLSQLSLFCHFRGQVVRQAHDRFLLHTVEVLVELVEQVLQEFVRVMLLKANEHAVVFAYDLLQPLGSDCPTVTVICLVPERVEQLGEVYGNGILSRGQRVLGVEFVFKLLKTQEVLPQGSRVAQTL